MSWVRRCCSQTPVPPLHCYPGCSSCVLTARACRSQTFTMTLFTATSRIDLECPNGGTEEKAARSDLFDKIKMLWAASAWVARLRQYPRNVKLFYWQGEYDNAKINADGVAADNPWYQSHPGW